MPPTKSTTTEVTEEEEEEEETEEEEEETEEETEEEQTQPQPEPEEEPEEEPEVTEAPDDAGNVTICAPLGQCKKIGGKAIDDQRRKDVRISNVRIFWIFFWQIN
jgi:hypothetical protein